MPGIFPQSMACGSVLSIGSSIFNIGRLVGRLVFADRFSCPLPFLFRTFNLAGQDHNGFWFMAESRQPELAVKPDMIGRSAGIFLP